MELPEDWSAASTWPWDDNTGSSLLSQQGVLYLHLPNQVYVLHLSEQQSGPDEVIRSFFYNKNNESLVTISVYESDRFSSLECRPTPIEYIRRGHLNGGFPLFVIESLKYPGFVEFGYFSGKVLTFSAQDSPGNWNHACDLPEDKLSCSTNYIVN